MAGQVSLFSCNIVKGEFKPLLKTDSKQCPWW